ncbi:MAG: hypothetical protein AAGC55_14200, partial [Myxococcota bacterium]
VEEALEVHYWAARDARSHDRRTELASITARADQLLAERPIWSRRFAALSQLAGSPSSPGSDDVPGDGDGT